jgi:hypothetical protein
VRDARLYLGKRCHLDIFIFPKMFVSSFTFIIIRSTHWLSIILGLLLFLFYFPFLALEAETSGDDVSLLCSCRVGLDGGT